MPFTLSSMNPIFHVLFHREIFGRLHWMSSGVSFESQLNLTENVRHFQKETGKEKHLGVVRERFSLNLCKHWRATALNISGIIRDMPVSQHTHSIICFGCLVNPRKLFVDKCDH